MKHLVKDGKKIKGFVYHQNREWWYAYGKPSQDNYISFRCRSLEHGIANVEMPTYNR